MILPLIETLAQVAVTRIFNSLPEGILIAVIAWAVLRILPKQNSGTRFAVWFLALLTVIAVPFMSASRNSGMDKAAWLAAPPLAIHLQVRSALLLLAIWLLIATLAIARLAVGLWRLRELRRKCISLERAQLDPLLQQTLAELAVASGLLPKRRVTVATSERIRVPAAVGLWKPMIVIPAWTLRELTPSDLSIIIRHEFAHLRRWDDWTNLLQRVTRAVLFFHPAVWWIEKRLSVEREMACDDAVLAETKNPTGYASCLVSVLEKSVAQRSWAMAQAIVHRAREATVRLVQILDRNRPVATHISKPAMGLVFALALVCLTAAPYSPQLVTFNRKASIALSHREQWVGRAQSDRARRPVMLSTLPTSNTPVAVVPAAWRSDSTSSKNAVAYRTSNIAAVRRTRRAREVEDSRIASAGHQATVPLVSVNEVHSIDVVFPFGTVVIVQSAGYVEADCPVARGVEVWRVTVITQNFTPLAGPAARSI
jgi:beta-lactamase regulating signal transducer with metallopeptidase domain